MSHPDHSILFDTPVIVRNEHMSILECWGVAARETIWLMDETGDWHELEEQDQNFELVVNSIHERLNPKGVKVA